MTKIDIFSGFLGAGKTTLIKKLLAEAYQGERLVLIENEFGDIGIDGGFLQGAGVVVNEMNSGCICCSLTGDFRKALRMVCDQYAPDRVLIEPSGVGKLSEIVAAVQSAEVDGLVLNGLTTVVDASKARVYLKNFGEFFDDQLRAANCIVLSRSGSLSEEKLAQAAALLRERNGDAVLVTTPWDAIDGAQLLAAIEQKNTVSAELAAMLAEHGEEECDDPDCGCHHHHHDDDDEDDDDGHCCHHHHDDDDEDDDDGHCCHHHHHDDDDDDEDDDHCCHHHHDDDDDDEDDDHCCHHHHDDDDDDDDDHDEHHHHHHHHGHDADEVFQSWGAETEKKFTADELGAILAALADEGRFGAVIRAKGYVPAPDGGWLHFDYTPGESDIRSGAANVTGRVCVIGAGLRQDAVKELFGLG